MIGVIIRDSAVGFVGVGATLALGFVSKALLARFLSVNEFGMLLTAQAVVGLGVTISQLSLPDAVVRFVGRDAVENRGRVRLNIITALKIGTVASVLTVCLLVLSAERIASAYREPNLALLLLVLAAALPFTMIGDVLAAGYRGLGKLWVKVACVDLCRPLWTVLILLCLISAFENTGSAALVGTLGYGLAAVLSALIMWLIFSRSHLTPARTRQSPAADLLRYSLPLLATSVLTGPIANTALPLLLGGLASSHAVAYYTVAVSLQQFVYLPTTLLEQAALPAWSGKGDGAHFHELRLSYALFTRWSFLIASAVYALLFFNARALLSALYGPAYEGAAPAVQLLGAVALFSVAAGPSEGMLRALGATRQIFWSRFAASTLALASAVPLIHNLGLMGGIAAVGLAGAVTNGSYAVHLVRLYNVHPVNGAYLKALAASGVALMAAAGLGAILNDRFPSWMILETVTYGGLFVMLAFLLQGITAEDIRILKRGAAVAAERFLKRAARVGPLV